MREKNQDKQLEFFRQELYHPDWYVRLSDYLAQTIFPVIHDNPRIKAERHLFYELVEEMLIEDQIPLAENGPDMDAERSEIDTVIVHHTEEESEIRLSKLSAIGFVRQYGKAYLEDDVWGKKGLRGKPIWSGHFRNGKMVFFAYHWLIRPDGKQERLLEDKEIGHQGHDLNPRSVGVALSGNYEHSTPPPMQIAATGEVIKSHYNFVDVKRVFGHLETNPERTCPGDKFLDGWKNTLLSQI